MAVALWQAAQSTPGSTHHGVVRSRSLLLTLSFFSSVLSSNSSSFRFTTVLSRCFLGINLGAGGGGEASKEMKSSCPSNWARDDAGVAGNAGDARDATASALTLASARRAGRS